VAVRYRQFGRCESEGAPIPSSAEIDEIQGLESQSPVYSDWEPTPQSPISNEQPTVSLSGRKRKKSNDLIGQALLNVETEKLRLLQNKEKAPIEKTLDEDRCFFESILPHVQKLSPLENYNLDPKFKNCLLACCVVSYASIGTII
jgi:hypothetical protein